MRRFDSFTPSTYSPNTRLFGYFFNQVDVLLRLLLSLYYIHTCIFGTQEEDGLLASINIGQADTLSIHDSHGSLYLFLYSVH